MPTSILVTEAHVYAMRFESARYCEESEVNVRLPLSMVPSYVPLLQFSSGIVALVCPQVAISLHQVAYFFWNSIQMKTLSVAKENPIGGASVSLGQFVGSFNCLLMCPGTQTRVTLLFCPDFPAFV